MRLRTKSFQRSSFAVYISLRHLSESRHHGGVVKLEALAFQTAQPSSTGAPNTKTRLSGRLNSDPTLTCNEPRHLNDGGAKQPKKYDLIAVENTAVANTPQEIRRNWQDQPQPRCVFLVTTLGSLI